LTGNPLHQGRISPDQRGFWPSPQRSMALCRSYRSFLEAFVRLRCWQMINNVQCGHPITFFAGRPPSRKFSSKFCQSYMI